MGERTSPRRALEKIAWYLSYRRGEEVPLNQIAEATGLAWATVHKYTQALEQLQKLAPTISTGDDGIIVGRRSHNVENLFNRPAIALAVYVLENAGEDATAPISREEHEEVLGRYADELDKLSTAGWVDVTSDTVRLTPEGIRVAGPARSRVETAEVPTFKETRRFGLRTAAIVGEEDHSPLGTRGIEANIKNLVHELSQKLDSSQATEAGPPRPREPRTAKPDLDEWIGTGGEWNRRRDRKDSATVRADTLIDYDREPDDADKSEESAAAH